MMKLLPLNTFTLNSKSLRSVSIALTAFVSLSASAANIDNNKHEMKIFNKDMNQLEIVDINDDIYVSTVSNSFEDITVETEYMSEYTLIKRVTDKEALEKDLNKTRSYYIYSINGLKNLTENVEKHLSKNKPAYFSTTLLKGNKYYNGFSEYIAKVTEYGF